MTDFLFLAIFFRQFLIINSSIGSGRTNSTLKVYKKTNNIFRKKYLSKISTTLDTLKAFLKIIYSESIDTPDYFIDKFYDNANEDSLKCISVHVPQTKNEFRNSEGLTDITYELIVHLATIPANHETNKEYQKELTKLIRFRGVCDNYPLEQRDLEFKVLESHLLTYIGKSNLISYDFT